jgi:hypothetical protein
MYEARGKVQYLCDNRMCVLLRSCDMQDIVGSVYELCKDQFGSRFIQMKVETATPEEVACHTSAHKHVELQVHSGPNMTNPSYSIITTPKSPAF